MDGLYKWQLNKCVMVNTYDQLLHKYGSQCKLSITGCEDSNIYIDSNVDSLLISGCANCTIFVAAVNRVCTIEKCENMTVCVASSQLRIGSCVDSLVHSYTPGFPPIIYGDTRSLRLAPHNASYNMMPLHLQRAGIRFDITEGKQPDWFSENINNFKKPVTFATRERAESSDASGNHTLLPLQDFNKMVLPNSMQDSPAQQSPVKSKQPSANPVNLLLCPPEYKEVIKMRLETFAMF